MNSDIIKRVLVQVGKTSTVHGLSNIFIAKSKILRIIWFISFLPCISFFVYQLTEVFLQYFEFKTISKYHIVEEVPTKFPAIDICNLNPYDGNQLKNYASQVLKNNSDSTKSVYFIQDVKLMTASFKSFLEKMVENQTYLFYVLGYYFYQMVFSCQYNDAPCYITDFKYYHNYDFGSCFSYNLGYDFWNKPVELKKSTQAGEQYGLQLEIFLGDPVNQLQYSFKKGIRVLVHNQSSEPLPSQMGVDIAPGTSANIAVSRTFINYLPLPYNDCVDKLDSINYQRNSVFKILYTEMKITVYNQPYCLRVCTQLYIISKCSCYDYSMPNITSINHVGCYNDAQLACTLKYYDILYKSFDKLCIVNCPIECHKTIYNTQISFSAYPTIWYADKIIKDNGTFLKNITIENLLEYNQWNYNYIKSACLKVNIFYSHLSYILVEDQAAIKFQDLLAVFGGSMALLLGTSTLTIIEAIEIVAGIIHNKMLLRSQQIQQNPVTSFKN